MSKILLSLLLIFLCLPKLVFAHSETRVIEITPSGFNPSEVTIDESSSVIFLNKDSQDRWPASNIHPTHEIYPGFDPKRPIKPSESWSFKPKVGVWKYHDHLLPHQRGAITVVAEDSTTSNTPNSPKVNLVEQVKSWMSQIWTKFKSFFNPLSKQYKALTSEDFMKLSSDQQFAELKKMADSNAPKSWQYIKDTFKGQAGSSGNIHDLAHLSGSLIYGKSGFDGIKHCSSEFAFGCYHGFLDEAFKKDLDHLIDAQNACMKLASGITGPVASCIHGIGHGVASFYSTNDLKGSLLSCRKLTQGQEYCFDGVFMEFVRSAPEAFFKKEDPLYPCNELEKEYGYAYSFACGRNQPSLLMSRFSLGFDQVVTVCLNSSSTPFKQACFDSLGFALASSDVLQIINGCQKIGVAEYVLRCSKAAAGELVFQEVPLWHEKSQTVCNAFPQGSDECLKHIERLIKEYGRQIQINFEPKSDNQDLASYIRQTLKVCFESGGRDGCYKQAADILYKQFGLKQTLQTLKENEGYPEVYARCHEVTHYLSRSEYEKQKSISKVYAQCDSTCHGGCYHGTLEAYLKEKDDIEGTNLAYEFSKVCGKQSDYQKPLEFNECLHGLGHAAMFVKEMELKDSLELCDGLNGQDPKERCYSGAFMENSSSSTSFDHTSIYIKADDPYYPCNILEEKYLPLCWQYQSSYFSIITSQNWVEVSRMCLQIPQQYQDNCFKTIGTNQVGFTSSLQKMKQDCDLMPTEHFKNICVLGVVSSLSYRFVGDAKKIIDFCSLVDSQNKETCFRQMGTGLTDWSTDKNSAKENCNQIPDPQGLNWCMSVI